MQPSPFDDFYLLSVLFFSHQHQPGVSGGEVLDTPSPPKTVHLCIMHVALLLCVLLGLSDST